MSALVPHTSHRTERMLETTFFDRGAIPKRHAQRRAQRTTIGHRRRARGMVIPSYPEIVPNRTEVRQPTTPLVRYFRPGELGGLGIPRCADSCDETAAGAAFASPIRPNSRVNSQTTMRTRFALLSF